MLSIATTVVAAYGALCLLAFVFQRRLLYFPGPPPARTPEVAGLAYDELRLVAADGVELHGWLVHPPQGIAAAPGVVLTCHGNAGNIEGRLPQARAFAEMGLATLLFDYRGYGSSAGRPSEEGTYLDAEAAWRYATEELGRPPAEIVAYGESLGGAIALELARRRPLAALFVESTFTSLPAVGQGHYPFLPVALLARDRYANIDKIGALDVPLLLVHAPADRTVPFVHAEHLLAAAPPGARLVRTRGDHNDGGFLASPEALAAVRAFLLGALGDGALGDGALGDGGSGARREGDGG